MSACCLHERHEKVILRHAVSATSAAMSDESQSWLLIKITVEKKYKWSHESHLNVICISCVIHKSPRWCCWWCEHPKACKEKYVCTFLNHWLCNCQSYYFFSGYFLLFTHSLVHEFSPQWQFNIKYIFVKTVSTRAVNEHILFFSFIFFIFFMPAWSLTIYSKQIFLEEEFFFHTFFSCAVLAVLTED